MTRRQHRLLIVWTVAALAAVTAWSIFTASQQGFI